MQGAAPAVSSVGVSGRLLFVDDPDPRVLQGAFALLFALDFVLRALGGSDLTASPWPAHALTLVLALCGLAALVPWERVPRTWVWVLPVVDIGALGMSRLSEEGSSAGFLVVLPALWLGRQFGRPGAVVAAISAAVLMAVPGLFYLGIRDANLARSLMIPAVAGWTALAIATGLARIRAGTTEAEERGTRLSEALDTIAHQRRFADAILDTVDVGLVLLDRTGAYQSMNRRHGDFMRLAYPDGHAGQAGQLGLVYHVDGVTPVAREDMPTYRAARGEEFDDCRIWVGDDPLTKRALSVSARAVRDERGEFVGAALAYNDVTDFMRALRVKDEFVASVSHELRTPLTSIMGYVDLLLDRPDLSQEQVAHLEVVARNTDRLRRLVADLLHTAQTDEGPMHVVRARADLAEIVRDSVKAAEPSAQAAGLTLHLECPEQLPVMVDAQRIAQVVDNLLSNAIKYTPDGGRVEVCLAVDGSRVELEVSDTGIGIAAHDRERLFTRFFRARHAEEHSIQGVGLGLSITKSIVESHGGRIEVESVVGSGSVFRVRLPLEVAHPPASADARSGAR